MIGLKNADVLPTDIVDELRNIISQIRGWALVEHEEDGTHRAGEDVTNFVPTGSIVPYGGSTAPGAWLLCDGSQVNRVAYKQLFAVISTTYGAGDGSTTFNLPDLRGRFPLGQATSGTGSTLGSTGGVIDHTHGVGSFVSGSHTHTISSGGAHTHAAGTLAGPSHFHTISSQAAHTHTISGSTASESSHTHTYSGTTDSETPILVSTDGAYETSSGSNDAHHTHAYSGTTDAGSAHSHTAGTLAADAGGSHDHTGTTGNSGTGSVTGATASDGAHDHTGVTGPSSGVAISGTSASANPPFISLNYIIKD